jgi:zinc/manganese transport system substrate-binding protein
MSYHYQDHGELEGLMKIKLALAACLTAIMVTTLSCQTAPSGGNKSIVVTYSILGSVVRDLVGDAADVTVSIPNGLDPHEFEPSAKDIEAVNKADLIIENGLDMLKTLDAARQAGVPFFTAADHIRIRHVGTGEGIPSGDPDQVVGAPDPHLWMDPLTIRDVVAALAPVLQQELGLDVAGAAASLEDRLAAENSRVEDILSVVPQPDRKLVTGHESMGYFADRYGFMLVGVIVPSLSSQAEVSAADLAALKQAIEANHVKAVFTEAGTSPAVASAIAGETGVKIVGLATHALPPDGSYFTFMDDIAGTIAEALK